MPILFLANKMDLRDAQSAVAVSFCVVCIWSLGVGASVRQIADFDRG